MNRKLSRNTPTWNHSVRTSEATKSWRTALPPAPARTWWAAAGGAAVRDDFTASLERTLWFQVGVFLLAFLFMLALPRGAGRRAAEHSAPEETAPALAEGIVTQ